MLEARSVAVLGATDRPGTLGSRLIEELQKSPGLSELHLVNPRRAGEQLAGRKVLESLDDIDGPVDLVAFAITDGAVSGELERAARRGDRSALIFGSLVEDSEEGTYMLRRQVAETAASQGMALCGGGCMGFVSPGLRAIGYLEPYPLPPGRVALVTHSGSAFSALLRADRLFGFSLAVSSGQELVTTASEYISYALSREETAVIALLLETMRRPEHLRSVLAEAAASGTPVVALTVGTSEAGRSMVEAHSGALAGSDAAWEALFEESGVMRATDLSELCDLLELLSCPKPPRRARTGEPGAIGAVFDSGAERALAVDLAVTHNVSFASIGPLTKTRLAGLLDPGLEPTNPLDVWGSGANTEELFSAALSALADDEAVDAVALAVDLVPEFDGDDSYRSALVRAASASEHLVCALSHLPSALDREDARRLRGAGIPVLEGTASGLSALGKVTSWHKRKTTSEKTLPLEPERAARWLSRLGAGRLGTLELFELLADYGIDSPAHRVVSDSAAARAAGLELGYPLALKTAVAGLSHKTEAGGVLLGIKDESALVAGYEEMAERLGEQATVAKMAPPGVELSLGVLRDPLVGPMVVLGAGGSLVELLADRAVALPPIGDERAAGLVERLKVHALLQGYRGGPPADLRAVLRAVRAVAQIASELGEALQSLEVNPLSCSPAGALALDVLAES
jgi:acyl-CoA synthetase (NDP forming)